MNLIPLIIGIIVIIFTIIFMLAGVAAYFEREEESRHLQFLSEHVGYRVLSLKEWCEEHKIDYDKYWDDSIVKRNYKKYITQIESQVISDAVRGE